MVVASGCIGPAGGPHNDCFALAEDQGPQALVHFLLPADANASSLDVIVLEPSGERSAQPILVAPDGCTRIELSQEGHWFIQADHPSSSGDCEGGYATYRAGLSLWLHSDGRVEDRRNEPPLPISYNGTAAVEMEFSLVCRSPFGVEPADDLRV